MTQNLTTAFILALFNALMLSSMSLFAKLLGQYFGPLEITFFRNSSSLIMLIIFLLTTTNIREILKTQRPWAHLIRSVIGTIGIVIGMWSFILSPLAVATLLFFTAPLFVALLSYPVLGERVGPWRLSSVFIGFIGVALIAAPAFLDGASELTILGVIVGISYGFVAGCVDLCLRWLGNTESSSTTTFYFLLFGILATSLYWPFSPNSPLDIDLHIGWIIFGLGLTGVLSLLAKSQSYRLAPASLVAPITFTMIIWAGLFDYFIWGHKPTLTLALGGAIIITSNLVILWREHKLNKHVAEI